MAQKLSRDEELQPYLEIIAFELYDLRQRRAISESPCLKDIEALVGMANTAHNKKLAFGFGCSSECPVIVGDFQNTTVEIDTAEGRTKVTNFSPDPYRSRRLFEAIDRFEKKLKQYGSEVFRGYGYDWKNLFSMNFYQFEEADAMRYCNVSDILAYHINGQFSMAASLTNESIYKTVPDGQRFGLTEYLTFFNVSKKDGNPRTIPLMDSNPRMIRLKSCTDEPWKPLPPKNGTAVMEVYGGRTDANHFKTTKIEENPAVSVALERGNAQKELVRDSRVLSNAAIMIVPACLAFVPLSLFHEVGAGMALLYAVLTDVVSVIPLAIKGGELIDLGSQVTWATQAHVYGMDNLGDDGTVELWTAQCWMQPEIKRTGIIFLVLAIFLMVLGLVLEVLFALMLRKQKHAWASADRVVPGRKKNAGVIWYWKNGGSPFAKSISPHPMEFSAT